ncbi:MAG TPA: LiaF-related protein [Thermomicrobiales bacterium]|jgi:hypothetical protein|nr:hypothetical protein [Chloroflexota bacterium]HCG29301.1 hypothetical protein [Chloroflexota bacterium]HQZ90025.1 LiaF-related protein [Thermomicrobiales bacterium]HRA32015.1 LiaF-related protein [Thermomicrobiales bacterium]
MSGAVPPVVAAPPPRREVSAGMVLLGGLLVVGGVLWLLQVAGITANPWRAALPGALIATGLAVLLDARRGLHGGLVSLGIVLTLALAAVSVTNVPLSGSIGERDYRPATLADISSPYELGVGDMTLDLSAISFPPGETLVVASVGMGQLEVILPAGVGTIVDWQVGAGDITIFDSFQQSGAGRSGVERREGSSGHVVRLQLSIGVGDIEVRDGR